MPDLAFLFGPSMVQLLSTFDIIRGKTFHSAFYFLTDHILSETICLFFFCFCSQNFYPIIKLTAKNCLNYTISIVKWFFFFIFVRVNIFLLWWIWIVDISRQYCENFRKNWTSRTCWKSASNLPTLQISALFAFIFTMGKRENICVCF